MPEAFHFLHPAWLLALLPLPLLLVWLGRTRGGEGQWRGVCDAHLLPYLLSRPAAGVSRLPVWLFAAGWLLAVIALADPVWQQRPQPVYSSQQARVLVLDLSQSMRAADLKPSRLAQARYKVADLLKQSREGQTGLVVFAGDAFSVAPLTNDTRTIRELLKPLAPALMPVQGSRVDRGLQQAAALLHQAGLPHGDILLITDGFSDPRAMDVARQLHRQGYRLSVLGVGTADGAPVPDGQGGYLRDTDGNIVMPKLATRQLQRLAAAGGGDYSALSTDDADLRRLLRNTSPALDTPLTKTDQQADVWRSEGPWLVLALLPLAALAFRRGWLLSLPLLGALLLGSAPQPAMAFSWDDLWARHDQQADRALQAGDLKRAQALARQPLRHGTAAYRAGDYDQAVHDFAREAGPQADYNHGNALAKLGRYQDAVDAYTRALQADPDLEDARYNKAQVEKLLQQQKQQQRQEQKQADGSDQNQGAASPQAGNQQQQNNGTKNQDGSDADNRTAQANKQPTQANNSKDKDRPENGSAEQQQANGDEDTQSREQAQAKNADAKQDKPSAGQATEQAANDKPANPPTNTPPPDSDQARTASAADTERSEQQQADERWLRRIPDDPGGLLRRKFLYQYSQRGRSADNAGQAAW